MFMIAPRPSPRVARLWALLCLFVIGASACGADLADPGGDAGGVLVLRESSPQRVSGTFERGGALLSFSAIQSGSGTLLTVMASDGTELARSEGAGATTTLRLLNGRLTYTGSSGDPTMTMSGDGGALGALLARPDARALPWLSQELGGNGLNGRSHPVTLTLHGLARFIATAGEIELPPLSARMSAEADSAAASRGCQDLRKDPKHDGCFGMCGKGCGCWSWTCGDCCWHKGCANHDTACRTCGIRNPGACAACASFSAFFTGGGC